MSKPEKEEIMDAFRYAQEEILAAKKLFDIHRMDQELSPEDARITERIIAGNFIFLTEKCGMGRDAYYALFLDCETKKDFAKLALLTYDFLIKRAKQYIEENPDLSEDGDALNPGKGNIRSGIMWNEEGKASIEERRRKGSKIPVIAIGGPALRETPDWLLVIKEQEMKMSEVCEMFAKSADRDAAADKVIDGEIGSTIAETRKQLNGIS